MTYATPYEPGQPPKSTKVDLDPKCYDCPHSAMDHNGDGWGTDEKGPFDWFLCPVEGCGCRVKGYLHVKRAVHPTLASAAAAVGL